MALKVGEVYVALTANVSGFAKGMGEALDSLAKVSKAVSRASRDIAQIGLGIGAALTAAANQAAKFDSKVAAAVESTKKQFNALSLEVGRAVAPAIGRFNDLIGNAVRALRSMDPELKAQIAGFAEMAVKVGLGAFVVSKITGAFGNLMEVASKLSGVVSLIFSPAFMGSFLAVVAGFAGLTLLVGSLNIAFKEWGGEVKSVAEGLELLVKSLREMVTLNLMNKVLTADIKDDQDTQIQSRYSNALDAQKSFEASGGRGAGFNGADLTAAEFKEQVAAMRENTRTLKAQLDAYRSGRGAGPDGLPDPGRVAEGFFGNMSFKLDETFTKAFEASGITEVFDKISGALKTVMGKIQAAMGGTGGEVAGPDGDIVQADLIKAVENALAETQRLSPEDHAEVTLLNMNRPDGARRNLGRDVEVFGTVIKSLGDVIRGVMQDLSGAASTIASRFAAGTPGLSGTFNAMVSGGEAAGPVGAVSAVFAELLTRSTQFARALELVNQVFQAVTDIVGALLEPFLPLVVLVREFWNGMKPLTQGFKVLEFVLRPIFEGLRLFYLAILNIAKAVTGFFGGDTSGFDASIAEFTSVIYDAALSTALLGDAARTAADAILNAPTGFRVESYIYGAQDPESGGGGVPGGGGGSAGGDGWGGGKGPSGGGGGPRGRGGNNHTNWDPQPVTVVIQGDMAALVKKIEVVQGKRNAGQYGNSLGGPREFIAGT